MMLMAACFVFFGTLDVVSAASNSMSVGLSVLSPVAPSVPVFTATETGAHQITVTGTAEPDATVYLTMTGTLEDDTIITPMTTMLAVSSSGTWSHQTATLAAGTYSFTAYAQNTIGDGPTSASQSVTIAANDSPSAPIFSLDVFDEYRIHVSGTAVASSTLYLTMTGTLEDDTIVTSVMTTIAVDASGYWQHDTSVLNAGTYSFAAYVTTPDGTGPTADSQSIAITMQDTDNVSITLENGDEIFVEGKSFPRGKTKVRIEKDDDVVDTATLDNDGSGDFSYLTDHLSPGTYEIFTMVVDTNGEQGSWAGPVTIVIPAASSAPIGSTEPVAQPDATGTPTPSDHLLDDASNAPDSFSDDTNAKTSTAFEERDETAATGDTLPRWATKALAIVVNDSARILANVAQSVGQFSADHPVISEAIVALGALAPIASMFGELGSLASLGGLLQEILLRSLAALSGIFGGAKRKRDWGLVYDGASGKPLSLAVVRLFGENGKFIESKVTDASGAYYFLVAKGKYTMKVEKEGYVMHVDTDMSARDVNVRYANEYAAVGVIMLAEGIICNDINMIDRTSQTTVASGYAQRIKKPFSFSRLAEFVVPFIFWGGFGYNLVIMITRTTPLSIFFTALYLAVWMMQRTFSSNAIRYGGVTNATGGKLPFVWINIYNKMTGVREARTITDEYGHYFLVLNPGQYVVEASSVNGNMKLVKEISFSSRGAFNERLVLRESFA
jgi:hypothetical protein